MSPADFYKAFDMGSNNSLVSKLTRYRFDRWTVRSIRNWLGGHIQRVAVNGSMELINKQCSSGSILGAVLSNIFIDVIDSEIECNLCKLGGDTKLSGTNDLLEGRSAIQGELDRLEE